VLRFGEWGQAGDEVADSVVEIGRAEVELAAETRLLGAELPTPAFLGFEVRVAGAESGNTEELEQCRRPEGIADRTPDLGVGLAMQVSETGATGRLNTELVVIVEAAAERQVDAIEQRIAAVDVGADDQRVAAA